MKNLRIVRHVGGWYAVHEVFYDENGAPHTCTAQPVPVGGETLDELRDELSRFIAALHRPVLEYDAL
jgi:hypothetical protein